MRLAITYALLIAGAILFATPLGWLLLTSFKEDRDLGQAEGFSLVPRVSVTRPYLDPVSPRFEAEYEGHRVVVTPTESQGRPLFEIQEPRSLRGVVFEGGSAGMKPVPRDAAVVRLRVNPSEVGFIERDLPDGRVRVRFDSGRIDVLAAADVEPVRRVGLRWQNYPDALDLVPENTNRGLVFLHNTLSAALMSVVGTVLSSALVAFAFARLRFVGKEAWFGLLLATLMLPPAVTMLPQFLIFSGLGLVDSLVPLWLPAFFGSAFNIFMLRQFFRTIPMELDEAARLDGCHPLRVFWSVLLPQVKPALAVISIWTFIGAWNNFMGPLIYISSPENMTLAYGMQLFQSERAGEPTLLCAFATMTIAPVVLVFLLAQRMITEGAVLSGFGSR